MALDVARVGVRARGHAQRRDATGVDIMRGLVLSRVGEGATAAEPMTERDDWFAALADIFGLRFQHTPPESVDSLWQRCLSAHQRWEAAGRP